MICPWSGEDNIRCCDSQVLMVCINFQMVRGGGGGGQREGRGATVHKYSSFLRPWGQQFTSWVENTNHE
jgi:hypothetical protein